jgi:peptidoglycan/xylan/chitin deacetylase (PgdA/CDA1 family)
MTFHGAGDLELAGRVLTVLHDRGAAVTVLAVGTWLQRYVDAARLVTDLGHELGNHTWSHPSLAVLDEPSVRTEIERFRDRIAAATGGPGAFFRPSQAKHATPVVLRGGRVSAGALLRCRLPRLHRPWTGRGPTGRPRGDRGRGHQPAPRTSRGTAEALPGVLDDLSGRELTPVTAGTLFS